MYRRGAEECCQPFSSDLPRLSTGRVLGDIPYERHGTEETQIRHIEEEDCFSADEQAAAGIPV